MASFEYGGLVEQLSSITTTSGGTTTLTVTSKQLQYFIGAFSQTMVLPDATTMSVGQKFEAANNCAAFSFTVTAANATAGTTYTNNSQTFTVATTIAGGTTLLATGTGAPNASGTLTKTGGGAGDSTITFSAVASVTSLLITINTNGGVALTTVPQTGNSVLKLVDNTTAAGTWTVNSPNVINGANTTSMTANTVGIMEIKCLSDTIGSGLQIQGTGAAANRGTFLTTRANGDFFLSNSNALNAFYLIGSGSGTLLGCGTTTPVYHYEVNFSDTNTVQTALTANTSTLALRNISATAGNFSSLVFQSSQNSTSSGTSAGGSGSVIQGVYDSHTVNTVTGHLSFLTRNSGTLAERVQITATGIGYGVGAPGQSLDVSANARIRGLTTAGPVSTDANGNLAATGGTPGTATNNNATAGNVGEFVSVNSAGVSPGSTGTFVNVASISLTAGDWDVYGTTVLSTLVTTATNLVTSISTSTGAQDSTNNGGIASSPTVASSGTLYLGTNPRRLSLAGTTTVYLVAALTFTVAGTDSYTTDSIIRARRIR